MPTFCLESADSVRLGPEYNKQEKLRNSRVLIGEALSALLLGETIGTNAVFAFESRVLVELLAALSKALKKKKVRAFLGFQMSVYDCDRDTFSLSRPLHKWSTPGEIYLRCYAHRIQNVLSTSTDGTPKGFQLSATPKLNEDPARRREVAKHLLDYAMTRDKAARKRLCNTIKALVPLEQRHFENVLKIDEFIQWSLGDHVNQEYSKYADVVGSRDQGDLMIVPIKEGWKSKYDEGTTDPAGFLRFATQDEIVAAAHERLGSDELIKPINSALEFCKTELFSRSTHADHESFSNRTQFRLLLHERELSPQDPIYRTLIELIDGHYIRTQYTELVGAEREITSPASDDPSSQAGEQWAAVAIRNARKSNAPAEQNFQFVNNIMVHADGEGVLAEDYLDQVAERFVACLKNHNNDLMALQEHLSNLRDAAGEKERSRLDELRELNDQAFEIMKAVNNHLKDVGICFDLSSENEANIIICEFAGEGGHQCTKAQVTGPSDVDISTEDGDIHGSNNLWHERIGRECGRGD